MAVEEEGEGGTFGVDSTVDTGAGEVASAGGLADKLD
jgi:hypothetical protein